MGNYGKFSSRFKACFLCSGPYYGGFGLCGKFKISYCYTKDGEAKAVIIDIESYQKTINAINLAKLLSLGEKDIKNGDLISHEDAKKVFEKTLAGKK